MTHRAPSALPSDLVVEQARDRYLAENGFTVAAYEAKWTPATLFGINIAVPNTPNHRRAIMWHDLHHVATGYGTDPAGEAEVSAWELRRGLKGLDLYVRALVISIAMLGAVVAPRRMWRAWVAAGRAGENSFDRELGEYDATLAIDLATLRAQLGVPPDGLTMRVLMSGVSPGGWRRSSACWSLSARRLRSARLRSEGAAVRLELRAEQTLTQEWLCMHLFRGQDSRKAAEHVQLRRGACCRALEARAVFAS